MRHPQLTEPGFRRLLAWLDGSGDSQGETYLEVRRRLIAYFDRGNCASPDELADETFNRVASTLEQSGTIAVTPPGRYCYMVARSVFRDAVRLVATSKGGGEAGAFTTREQRLECLDRCLNTLDPAQRALIVEYYRADGRDPVNARRELAARLGLTMTALSSRASHIRGSLERCVANSDRLSSRDRNEGE